MKKYVAICLALAALAWVGAAAATITPQGKLTGSAVLDGFTFTVSTPILDGGTTYVGMGDDKSGNCSGDSGVFTYAGITPAILCAHFVASSRDGSGPKMRLAFVDSFGCWRVFRISDGGATDKVGESEICGAYTLQDVENIVNTGRVGAGFGGIISWVFTTVDGFTVTASQT